MSTLTVERNEVVFGFSPQGYKRGKKKEAGKKFVGAEINPSNLDTWVQWMGKPFAAKVCDNWFRTTCQQITTQSTNQAGEFVPSLWEQNMKTLDQRVESKADLLEKKDLLLAEITKIVTEFASNPVELTRRMVEANERIVAINVQIEQRKRSTPEEEEEDSSEEKAA